MANGRGCVQQFKLIVTGCKINSPGYSDKVEVLASTQGGSQSHSPSIPRGAIVFPKKIQPRGRGRFAGLIHEQYKRKVRSAHSVPH